MKFFFILIMLILSLLSLSIHSDDKTPTTVYLRAGSILTSIADEKKEVVIEKGMYVKAYEASYEKRSQFIIYNKLGAAEFYARAEDIVEFADQMRLLPNEKASLIYPPKNIFKSENTSAHFDSQFNIHMDSLNLSTLNEIYSDQISSVISYRYEARTIYVTELPLNFGFTINYQSAFWKNDIEEVKLSILSLGPVLQYSFFHGNEFVVNGLLSAEIAPLYSGLSSAYTDKYSATLLDLGVESEWSTKYGVFTLGSHFRHHQLALENSNRTNLQLLPKEFTLNSLGLMVGYKIEWDL